MKKLKNLFLIVFMVFLLVPLVDAKATTVEELQAKIKALLTQVTELQRQLTQIRGEEVWCHDFHLNLKYGMAGTEVRALQTALGKEGFYERTINNTFDEYTASTVVGFQEKHASEILASWGLKHGTGYVGDTTRAKLNKLYGCVTSDAATPTFLPFYLVKEGTILVRKNSNISLFAKQLANNKNWNLLEIDTADSKIIRNKIINLYNQSHFEFLLILGDDDQIPIFNKELLKEYILSTGFNILGGILQKDENVLDSLYYGNIDNDLYVELAVGRLPFNDTKTLEYYYNNFQKVKNINTIHAVQVPKQFNVPDILYIKPTLKNYKVDSFTKAENKEIINEKLLQSDLFLMFTHGGPDYWAVEGGYSSIDIPILNKKPIIIGEACSSAKELGKNFIKKNALAYIGYYIDSKTDNMFFLDQRSIKNTIGEIMLENINYNFMRQQINPGPRTIYYLIGDPSLVINYPVPQQLSQITYYKEGNKLYINIPPSSVYADYVNEGESKRIVAYSTYDYAYYSFEDTFNLLKNNPVYETTTEFMIKCNPSFESGALFVCRDVTSDYPNCPYQYASVFQKSDKNDKGTYSKFILKIDNNYKLGNIYEYLNENLQPLNDYFVEIVDVEGQEYLIIYEPSIVLFKNINNGKAFNNRTLVVELTATDTPPSITVLSPNGGEKLTVNSQVTIRWQLSGPTSSTVLLEVRKGSLPYIMISSAAPNTGLYTWTVPAGLAGMSDLKIRVTDQNNRDVFDESNNYFSIVPLTPSITVLSPNGGEVWEVGKTYNIKWNSTGLEKVNINLLSADPVNVESYRVARLVSNLSASIGNYSWVIPEKTECLSLPCITLPEHRNHKIEIVDARYGRDSIVSKVYSDSSDAPFSIVAAATACTDTDGGDNPYVKGVTSGPLISGQYIEHTDRCIITSGSGGGTWVNECLGSNCSVDEAYCKYCSSGDANCGTFTGYYVYTYPFYKSCLNGCKDGACLPSTTPSITVLSPNGGERWTAGTTQTIKWTPSSSGTVRLEIRKGASPYVMISSCCIPDTGLYSWPIPAGFTLASDYRVRVTKNDGAGPYDESDGPFSIVAAGLTRGVCGSAQGVPSATQPTANLCSTGSVYNQRIGPNSVNWLWDCAVKNPNDVNDVIGCWAPISQPSITLIYPKDGYTWYLEDQNFEFRWSTSNFGSSSIWVYLQTNDGKYIPVALSVPNAGSYILPKLIPVADSVLQAFYPGSYKAVVCGQFQTTTLYSVCSNIANITISSRTQTPSITVLSPNGGERWAMYNTYEIKWKCSISQRQYFENVYLYKGNALYDTITSIAVGGISGYPYAEGCATHGTNAFLWRVDARGGLDPATNYQIRVELKTPDGTLIGSDSSDASFSIVSGGLGMENIEKQLASISKIVSELMGKIKELMGR